MKKTISISSRLGHVDNFVNESKTIVLAKPHGYIGPQLLLKDLEFLTSFDKNSTTPWKYIVDTSKTKFVNPINPFLLRKLRGLSHMQEYVVYVPSPFVRFMIRTSGWINKPDRIVKDLNTFQLEINDS